MSKKQIPAAVRPPLADRVFDLLEGSWMIEREIRPKGYFSGTAGFSRVDAKTLAYVEEGTLTMTDGQVLSGERRHTYLLHEDRIEVLFVGGPNHGEHFVDILFPADPEADWPLCSGDTHFCQKDTYKAMFCFENIDEFDVTYTVCGPAKDYVSHSVYRRIKVTA
jgi:hypothetical protein